MIKSNKQCCRSWMKIMKRNKNREEPPRLENAHSNNRVTKFEYRHNHTPTTPIARYLVHYREMKIPT